MSLPEGRGFLEVNLCLVWGGWRCLGFPRPGLRSRVVHHPKRWGPPVVLDVHGRIACVRRCYVIGDYACGHHRRHDKQEPSRAGEHTRRSVLAALQVPHKAGTADRVVDSEAVSGSDSGCGRDDSNISA